jgi:hypothetical protein
LQPSGSSTSATWTMSGPLTYPGKLISVFMSMDKLIGSDFETGLNNMKAAAEK